MRELLAGVDIFPQFFQAFWHLNFRVVLQKKGEGLFIPQFLFDVLTICKRIMQCTQETREINWQIF